MTLYFYLGLAFVFGAVIGSFLNVLIYRMPRQQSIVFPHSHCTSCGHRLGAADLFPIFSYLFLRGRCRYCGVGISHRYPLVEFLNGSSFVLAYALLGMGPDFLKAVTAPGSRFDQSITRPSGRGLV
jgi:prepilin signal peptidase PulO-like enzyme (type II secretory pathway)